MKGYKRVNPIIVQFTQLNSHTLNLKCKVTKNNELNNDERLVLKIDYTKKK